MLHGDTNDFAVFLDRDGGRLAGGADDADAIGAFADVPVDQAPQRGVVDLGVVEHRRHQRDDAAYDGCHGQSCYRWQF
jgi:hypothetical protein